MNRRYWLVKSEPETYSWQDFLKDEKATWDGVRNYQARNNLKLMKRGDLVLFYHSQSKEKQIVGVGEVVRPSYPDPTTKDNRWVAVDLASVETFENPIALEKIKSESALKNLALVKQSRLSVMPVAEKEYKVISDMGKSRELR